MDEKTEKLGWALVAALSRIAEGIEGVRQDLGARSDEHRIISEKRRAAGRAGGLKRAATAMKADDGTFLSKQTPSKNQANSQADDQANTKQTPGKGQAKAKQTPGKSVRVWESYQAAYFARYRVNPIRNHQVNSLLCKLVDMVGEVDAPKVAAFYLTHGDRFYLNAKHPVGLLLRDWQKLHNEMQTGARTTTGRAAKLENEQAIDDAFDAVIRAAPASRHIEDDEVPFG